jgi:hypothetical protein
MLTDARESIIAISKGVIPDLEKLQATQDIMQTIHLIRRNEYDPEWKSGDKATLISLAADLSANNCSDNHGHHNFSGDAMFHTLKNLKQ